MKLIRTLSVLALLATTGIHAAIQTQDPHSYCAVLYGFTPGSDEYNECVQKVKESNARAQKENNNGASQQNASKKHNQKSCCQR